MYLRSDKKRLFFGHSKLLFLILYCLLELHEKIACNFYDKLKNDLSFQCLFVKYVCTLLLCLAVYFFFLVDELDSGYFQQSTSIIK